MEIYPVKFEAYQDGEAVFKVEAFDSSTATVRIDEVVTVESWDEIAARVRECIIAMRLDTTPNAIGQGSAACGASTAPTGCASNGNYEERKEDMSMCIYHANCADGFGAAWVVRKALGDIDFHPGKYQEPPPDVTGKDVVMVDFSYKRPVLLEMAEKANSILILDHHKTAAEDLVDLPANVTAKFDMGHSGAMLTWEHFFPGQEPPPLLLHIEDRDLWRFALQNTRQIQASVFSFPYDFQVWDTLMATAPAALAAEGEAIERKHFKDIRELLGVTTREMVIGGHRVPVANLPYTMSSDAGHELAKGRPFAACYWDTPEGRVFSLRSSDDGADVAEVAKQYGGGGHRNAAGFRVSFAQAQAFEV